MKQNWSLVFDSVVDSLAEEALALENSVADEDTSCITRELRRERAATLRHVLAVMDIASRRDYS